MASRWFVLWIALFVIAWIEDWALWLFFLVLAYMCGDPMDAIRESIYQDTKRIVSQYFKHYFSDK